MKFVLLIVALLSSSGCFKYDAQEERDLYNWYQSQHEKYPHWEHYPINSCADCHDKDEDIWPNDVEWIRVPKNNG